MRFPLTWPERLYGLVLMTYPRSFRVAYEHDMRTLFRDLLRDPDFGAWRLSGLVLRDLIAGITRPEHMPSANLARQSLMFGLLVDVFELIARSLHPGAYLGFTLLPVPFIAFIPAGFWGARQSRSFAGGMWAALIMGAASSLSIAFEALVFRHWPFRSPFEFLLAMAIAIALCLVPAAIGSIAGAALARRNESGA